MLMMFYTKLLKGKATHYQTIKIKTDQKVKKFSIRKKF